MAGAACAKVIIDRGNAAHQTVQCMNATILLVQPGQYPTEEMESEFVNAAERLAAVATKISKALGATVASPPRPAT